MMFAGEFEARSQSVISRCKSIPPAQRWRQYKVLCPVLLGLLTLCSAVGCGSMSEAVLPPMTDDMVGAVTLRTPTPLYSGGTDATRIVSVDGYPPYPYDYEVVLPPGRHALQLDITYTVPISAEEKRMGKKELTTRSVQSLEFVAQADRNYRIQVLQYRDQPLHVWIIDEVSKDVVAGNAP